MATPIKPSAAGTPVQHEKVSFGDSSTILREGNMEMFLPLASKEDLLKVVPNAKTVPQIFIEDRYIGGYTELMEYFALPKT